MADPLRTIAVFGGGVVALSAAAAFARALPRAAVRLIATARDPAALADRLPGTLPSIHRFHDRIGLTDDDMLRRAGALPRLAILFEHWSASGEPWLAGFGRHGPSGVAGFHQHWLAARAAGDTTPFHAHQSGAMLALAGRFAPSPDPASPLADADSAYTLDMAGYRAGLTALARHLRVTLEDGAIGDIDRTENGGIAAVRLTDGRRVEADLFLDCTGPDAALLAHLDPAREAWDALPCDRLLLADAPPIPNPFGPVLNTGLSKPASPTNAPFDKLRANGSLVEPTLFSTVTALPCGWRWRDPGRRHATLGLAYASHITPAEEAARVFRRETGQAPAETLTIRLGRAAASWVGNVIAFGDAAVVLDPLVGANLALAHSAILRALDLLPDRTMQPMLRAEYNRRTAAEADRARDFTAAHYARSGRSTGAFWRAAAARPLPPSLAATLALFEARGRLPHFEEETFDADAWQAALLGMGVIPAMRDPVAAAMPTRERDALLDRSAARIAAAVAAVSPFGAP